jgi:hypothetical protein
MLEWRRTLSNLERAAHWFLQSGIQHPGGGVARYYNGDLNRNLAVSTEITGYTASALVYLHTLTGDKRFLSQAIRAARFLTHSAWQGEWQAMPFELDPPRFAYFFDCGIIVRGWLAVWRAGGDPEFLEAAVTLGRAMARDFADRGGDWHPVVKLPGKNPAAREPLRWSRSPGCYQLKAAMAWRDLDQATGGGEFDGPFRRSLEAALATHDAFLPGHSEPAKVVDRLHAYLYFLEGLLPAADDPRCAAAIAAGIERVANHAAAGAGHLERADVYAQLLRMRLYAAAGGVAPLDGDAAEREAGLLRSFHVVSPDARIDGGYYFGRQGGRWSPHVSPVSTAFTLQALAMWDARQSGLVPDRYLLI